ncbi:response regulator [Colwelliaceae bacterium 6441]
MQKNNQYGTKPFTKHRLITLTIIICICLSPLVLSFLAIDFSSVVTPLTNESLINNQLDDSSLLMSVYGDLHHALLEWSAIGLALITALLSFFHYRAKQDVTIPIIGIALLSVGFVDIFHTLAATKVIFANAPNSEFIPFSWVLSRLFAAMLMLMAVSLCFWLSRKFNQRLSVNQQTRLLVVFSIILALLVFVTIYIAISSSSLPQTVFANAFISRPYDILPLALFFCTGAIAWLWFYDDYSALRLALFLSILPQIVTQLHMGFGSIALFDHHFNVAHFFKIISTGIVLIGLLVDLPVQESTSRTQGVIDDNTQQFNDKNLAITHKVDLGKVKWPLALKIPLAGFLFSFVILLTIAFTFYIESYQLVKDKEMRELSLEAEIVKPLFSEFYRQSSRDVSFLQATPPIEGIIKAKQANSEALFSIWRQRLNSIFIELLKTKPHYKRMSYITISSSNDVLVSAVRENDKVINLTKDKLIKGIELTDLKPMLTQQTSAMYFSKIIRRSSDTNDINRLSSNASYFVASPVFEPQSNELFGIIAIEVNLSSYISELKKQSLKDIIFYIANEQGDILYCPRDVAKCSTTETFIAHFPQLAPVISTNKETAQLYDFNKEKSDNSLAFYSKMNFEFNQQIPSLHLLIENQQDDLLFAVKNMRFRAILLSLSLALLSLVISIFAARKLTRSLSTMRQSLFSFENKGEIGDLPTSETDEIGLLARSFHNLFVTIEHKSSELELVATQAHSATLKLQAILNSIVDAVITINTQGEILAFNKAARKMFGYKEEEVLHQNIEILMPVEFAKHHNSYLDNFLKTGKSKVFGIGRELPALRSDGEVFPMLLSISEVITDDGKIFTGLIRDITENKLLDAEKKRILNETKNAAWRLNFALSAPKIGVWDLDLSSKHILWDERMYKLFDTSPESNITPKDIWLEKIHPEDVEHVEALLAKSILSGKEIHYQHRIITSNNQIKYIEAHAQVMFDDRGERTRVVGTYRDNTEQQQLHLLKQQALDMAEESLRLKSEFLASMSHEIRTPMNGVLGMLGLLEQSKLSKQQEHYVQLASSSAHSLLFLINDILDFSKIEAGKLELEVFDFDLRSQLGEFAESMAVRAQEKGLELVLDLTQINDSMVKGDPSRIRQILSNLVGNAIKFTESGEVIIKASVVKNTRDNKLNFSCDIIDTGIGIPENKINNLFDSFTQVDATTTRKYGGTGLGLAIVKQLCELMGGNVKVKSEINKGSCFTFTIELVKSDKSKLVMPAVDISGTEILIVDDNDTNLAVLKGQLEIWGAVVTQAHDGYEALSLIEKEPKNKFAVAILDMQMPGMDGATLGRFMKENSQTSSTKLIMMTSMGERGDAAYFSSLGFAAYFPKPATTSDLFNALSIVLDDTNAATLDKDIITHHSLRNIHRRPQENKLPRKARILLVEDNRINQVVILGVLANIYLHADVAENGLEALECLKNESKDTPFEIIIMDCQMPELDGYETTKIIREGGAGEHYQSIPIIAMTANAMKGDKEKCLTAGMSDYATKPVDALILQQKLCHWLGEEVTSIKTEKVETTQLSSVNQYQEDDSEPTTAEMKNDKDLIWHKEGFLKRIRNNINLAEKLIKLFLEDGPQQIKDLQDAITKTDNEKIVSIAHKLKGSVKNLGGNKLAQLLEVIEINQKSGSLEKLDHYKLELTNEFENFIAELQGFID